VWNLLIAEDQALVREGLKLLLEQDPQLKVVALAKNGEEAIQKMEQHIIDLILMDVRMPVMNGLDATKIIKSRWPGVKIFILTTFNDEEYAIRALKYGANAFMLKTAEQKDLIHAVYSCMRGAMPIHEEVTAKFLPKLLEGKKSPNTEIPLTERERAIVKLVGEGKSNKEIARELFLSVGTVKNHISQILQKLHLRDRTQLAIFAVKNDLS
jgi:Response regulator receiver domain./Bacterial regulatory proteins, luxR family.